MSREVTGPSSGGAPEDDDAVDLDVDPGPDAGDDRTDGPRGRGAGLLAAVLVAVVVLGALVLGVPGTGGAQDGADGATGTPATATATQTPTDPAADEVDGSADGVDGSADGSDGVDGSADGSDGVDGSADGVDGSADGSDGSSDGSQGPAAAPLRVRVRAADRGYEPVVRERAGRRADLEQVSVEVVLVNDRTEPLTVEQLGVTGLGLLLLDVAEPATVAPGQTFSFAGSLTPDCSAGTTGRSFAATARARLTVRQDGARSDLVVPVVADRTDTFGGLCPQPRNGLHVAVAGVLPEGLPAEGRFTLRLVNHGKRSTLVVPRLGPDAKGLRLRTRPAAPLGLVPGRALLVGVSLDVPACPAPDPALAVQQVGFEAESPEGFVEVTGWPEDLVLDVLRAARRRCG